MDQLVLTMISPKNPSRFAQCFNDLVLSTGEEVIMVSMRPFMCDIRSASYNPMHPNFDPAYVAAIIHQFLDGDNTEYDQMKS